MIADLVHLAVVVAAAGALAAAKKVRRVDARAHWAVLVPVAGVFSAADVRVPQAHARDAVLVTIASLALVEHALDPRRAVARVAAGAVERYSDTSARIAAGAVRAVVFVPAGGAGAVDARQAANAVGRLGAW